jgi:hypothetical protein
MGAWGQPMAMSFSQVGLEAAGLRAACVHLTTRHRQTHPAAHGAAPLPILCSRPSTGAPPLPHPPPPAPHLQAYHAVLYGSETNCCMIPIATKPGASVSAPPVTPPAGPQATLPSKPPSAAPSAAPPAAGLPGAGPSGAASGPTPRFSRAFSSPAASGKLQGAGSSRGVPDAALVTHADAQAVPVWPHRSGRGGEVDDDTSCERHAAMGRGGAVAGRPWGVGWGLLSAHVAERAAC